MNFNFIGHRHDTHRITKKGLLTLLLPLKLSLSVTTFPSDCLLCFFACLFVFNNVNDENYTKMYILHEFFKQDQKATMICVCSKDRPSYLLQGADSCSPHQFLCPCSFLDAEKEKNLFLKVKLNIIWMKKNSKCIKKKTSTD